MDRKPDIVIAPHTQSHVFVWTSESIERELSDEFSFVVPGAEFIKRRRKIKYWDDRIRLYNRTTKLIYAGLVSHIVKWAARVGYTVDVTVPDTKSSWTEIDTSALLASYPTPGVEVRDYQRTAITHGLHHQRVVLLSPTASGKSLVLYYLVRARMAVGPVLLIVPTISLVSQMVEDWRSYGWDDVDDHVHRIVGGVTKTTTKPVVVSTWQSIFRQPVAWFDRYTTLLGDEAHTFKASSLTGIMNKLPQCAVRIGVTGTLDGAKSNKLSVEGVFGPSYRVVKTATLQTQGYLAPLRVQGHLLQYAEYDRWAIREHHRSYVDEVGYFVDHPQRLAWTANFVNQLPGNVLVLYQYVERHGIPLYHACVDLVGGSRPVYFVSGAVAGDERERIRALMDAPECITLTFGEMSVTCAPTTMVPLETGDSKPALDITTEDDVSRVWVMAMQQMHYSRVTTLEVPGASLA